MSFLRPHLSALIEAARRDIEARLPGADARLRRSALDVIARVFSGAIDGLYSYLGFIARQLMPDTAEREYLDRWASIWGVQRKAASAAAGTITVLGLEGAIVSAGEELLRADGAIYRVAERREIGGGSAEVPVAAASPGAAGALDAGRRLRFRSPVPGVNAEATSAAGLIGAADEETDGQLLARLLARIRKPPEGGAATDYEAWALQRPGVTRAWSYRHWMGVGTVGVTFVYDGREDIIPTEAEVEAMAAHLVTLRPVTATVVVFAPTPLPVRLLLTAVPASPEVRAAITAEVDDLFAREAAPGEVLLLTHIASSISLAAGEHDHQLHAPAGNIAPPPGVIPLFDGIDWA